MVISLSLFSFNMQLLLVYVVFIPAKFVNFTKKGLTFNLTNRFIIVLSLILDNMFICRHSDFSTLLIFDISNILFEGIVNRIYFQKVLFRYFRTLNFWWLFLNRFNFLLSWDLWFSLRLILLGYYECFELFVEVSFGLLESVKIDLIDLFGKVFKGDEFRFEMLLILRVIFLFEFT